MVKGSQCEVCGEEARFSCGACGLAGYCSKDHQTHHWSLHKQTCSPYKVVENDLLGRHLVARRAIRRGEVVLRERPLVTGPSQTTGPVCLGCHEALQQPVHECHLCGWPMCSKVCASSPHHVPECTWAQTKRKAKVKITQMVSPHPTYGSLLVLRALYCREAAPEVWAKLTSLESHMDHYRDTEKARADSFSVAGLLRRFYRLEQDFSEEDILTLCAIIQVNGHEVPLSEPSHVSVYWHGSLLEHSCRATCSKSFSEAGELVVAAAQDLSPGAHISICYTDPLWPTPARQTHLRHTKFFSCTCRRCQDPTELASYFSAINCIYSGCKGRMLSSRSTWRCESCGDDATEDLVHRMVSRLSERLANTDKADLPALEAFLGEARSHLPPGHQYVTQAGLALAQGLGHPHGLHTLHAKQLTLKETLLRHLLKFTENLIPGECRIRGVLNFELHACLAERVRRETTTRTQEWATALLLESQACLGECLELLKWEPACLPEGQIYQQAQQNLRDLQTLLTETRIDPL